MNFNQLKYYQYVYESHNITKAAERLHVSQPAVSTAIQELETELEVQLFVRQNRGLTATEEGTVFYEQVCRILAQCENAKRMVREVAERKHQVRIGMAPMSGYIVFPKIYRKLSKDYPEIELEILEGGSFELVKALEGEELEAVIIPDGVECPGCEKHEIYRSRMVFAISKEHPLAKKDTIVLEDLAGVPIAIHRKGFVQNENITELFERHGIPMKKAAESSNFVTIKSLISCGAAGGFLLKEIFDGEEGIRTYELPELSTSPVYLVWKKDGYLSKTARQFIRCCRGIR